MTAACCRSSSTSNCQTHFTLPSPQPRLHHAQRRRRRIASPRTASRHDTTRHQTPSTPSPLGLPRSPFGCSASPSPTAARHRRRRHRHGTQDRPHVLVIRSSLSSPSLPSVRSAQVPVQEDYAPCFARRLGTRNATRLHHILQSHQPWATTHFLPRRRPPPASP